MSDPLREAPPMQRMTCANGRCGATPIDVVGQRVAPMFISTEGNLKPPRQDGYGRWHCPFCGEQLAIQIGGVL